MAWHVGLWGQNLRSVAAFSSFFTVPKFLLTVSYIRFGRKPQIWFRYGCRWYKLHVYTIVIRFSILIQNKTKYFKKPPQLNFSQASLIVSKVKIVDSVSIISHNGMLLSMQNLPE